LKNGGWISSNDKVSVAGTGLGDQPPPWQLLPTNRRPGRHHRQPGFEMVGTKDFLGLT